MSETKKPPISPVVARANALIERIHHYEGMPPKAGYQLARPFDGSLTTSGASGPKSASERAVFVAPHLDEADRPSVENGASGT